jgi:CheY-like chemotaxis protein
MVVEDEPDIYEVLLAMFEMWGIEGVAFVDGEEAIAWIEDVDNGHFQGELPELALLDIRLPGEINGVAVGERLRQSPRLGQMAIVLTTAYRLTPEEQEEAMQKSGADKWLPKPLPRFEELQQVLEDVLAARRAKQQATTNAESNGYTDTDSITPADMSKADTPDADPSGTAPDVPSAPDTKQHPTTEPDADSQGDEA